MPKAIALIRVSFVRGVHAFDVEGRIGFGVAQALGFLEHHVKVQALVAHLGQDEVGGAVDDAGDPLECGWPSGLRAAP